MSILAGFKGLLLENVASFTTFPVGGHSVATKKGIRIEGGIKGGVLKFVTAALLDMDLQVRVGFLQTANHGVPQHRRRFFIIATPRSTPMMEMPVAVTTYGSAIKTVTTTLAVGPNRDIFINSYGTDRPGAPHKVPNVLSTYSDLPGFEIRDPDVFSPEDDAYTALVKRRASIYQSYDVDNAVAKGFFGKIEQGYGGPPRTNFQRLLRGDSLRLHEHVTPQVSELWARKISRVALHGGAGYFTLPQVFWDSKNGNSAKVSCPVRLSRTGLFRTISATLNPGQKQEHVVHPTQRRLLTIREIARAQGFPDSFVFHDTESQERVNVKEMVAQVGNAVSFAMRGQISHAIRLTVVSLVPGACAACASHWFEYQGSFLQGVEKEAVGPR